MKKKWSILCMTLLCVLMAAPAALAADGEAAKIDTGDTAWVLISAALVFIMTPGLAFFYGGMVRSKNVLTTIMQSFFIIAMISVEWVILGYAMTFGTDIGGFIGFSNFGLSEAATDTPDGLWTYTYWFFQCVFAATVAV